MQRPIPSVSIGMPVYNGASHLRQALDALLSGWPNCIGHRCPGGRARTARLRPTLQVSDRKRKSAEAVCFAPAPR
jgi:hypothetical protein